MSYFNYVFNMITL